MVVELPRKVRMSKERWLVNLDRKYVLSTWTSVLYWHHSYSRSQRITMVITGGSEETLLNIVRLCEMEIPPSGPWTLVEVYT